MTTARQRNRARTAPRASGIARAPRRAASARARCTRYGHTTARSSPLTGLPMAA
jgi:hypothetical protein